MLVLLDCTDEHAVLSIGTQGLRHGAPWPSMAWLMQASCECDNVPWYRTFPIKVGNALIELHRFYRIKVGSSLSSNFRSQTLFDVLDNESVSKT